MPALPEEPEIWRVSVKEIRFEWDPLYVWDCLEDELVSPDLIGACLDERDYEFEPYDPGAPGERKSMFWHARRIALFVDSPNRDPILIRLRKGRSLVDIDVADGNHRLAAAIFRGDRYIRAIIEDPDGCLMELLPGSLPDEGADSPSLWPDFSLDTGKVDESDIPVSLTP